MHMMKKCLNLSVRVVAGRLNSCTDTPTASVDNIAAWVSWRWNSSVPTVFSRLHRVAHDVAASFEKKPSAKWDAEGS